MFIYFPKSGMTTIDLYADCEYFIGLNPDLDRRTTLQALIVHIRGRREWG